MVFVNIERPFVSAGILGIIFVAVVIIGLFLAKRRMHAKIGLFFLLLLVVILVLFTQITNKNPWKNYGVDIEWKSGGASSRVAGADLFYQGEKLKTGIFTSISPFTYRTRDIDKNGVPEIIITNPYVKVAYHLRFPNRNAPPILEEEYLECYKPWEGIFSCELSEDSDMVGEGVGSSNVVLAQGLIEKVRNALQQKYPESDFSDYYITVENNYMNQFIEGGASAGPGGFHYWAAFVDDVWIIVEGAQDQVPCSIFEPYGFPEEIIEDNCF